MNELDVSRKMIRTSIDMSEELLKSENDGPILDQHYVNSCKIN